MSKANCLIARRPDVPARKLWAGRDSTFVGKIVIVEGEGGAPRVVCRVVASPVAPPPNTLFCGQSLADTILPQGEAEGQFLVQPICAVRALFLDDRARWKLVQSFLMVLVTLLAIISFLIPEKWGWGWWPVVPAACAFFAALTNLVSAVKSIP